MAQHPGGCGGDGYGHKGAGTPFEEQQLDGEQDGGERSGKDSGHARGRSGDEEGGALRVGEVKELAEQRADRAGGHDDGAFGAEWAAGTDGDRGAKRLEQRDARD